MHDQWILFTVPFAGGSSYSYNFLEPFLPPQVQLMQVELPGRGKRAGERLRYHIDELAEDIMQQTGNRFKGPYAIYGHSMGALLSYQLIRLISAAGGELPRHLFVSGRRAPSVKAAEPPLHHLPQDVFLKKVKEMGGCPDALFEDPGAGAFFAPILRADFQCVEKYVYRTGRPMPVPISVLYGLEESIQEKDVRPWMEETTAEVDFHTFSGNHFFIFRHASAIATIISKKLISETWKENCSI